VNLHTMRPLVAEFVGTALFVFMGVGSVVANAASGNALGAVGTALVHGVALAIIVTVALPISGGHINPAVSFALWLARVIDARRLGLYVVAQLLGAVVGTLLVKAFFPAGAARVTSLGTPQLSGTLGIGEGIGLEALLTFFLASAVFGTCVTPLATKLGGWAIGLSVLVCALVGGGLTGAAMNPARAFGPALISSDWHAQMVYWVGPLLGASLAAALWRWVLLPRNATDLT
jgi:MIP family channel proteins